MSKFVGEFKTSKRQKHSILIYKLRSDPTKCFRFTWAREGAYHCQGCRDARKSDKSIKVKSIRVKNNVFLTDPEEIEHRCIPFTCEKSAITQIYRECLDYGRSNNLDELTVSALIKRKALEQFPETWEQILSHCPSMRKIKDTMVQWEKHRKMYTSNMPKQITILPNDYHETDSNMIRHDRLPDGNQFFLIMGRRSFEIFYRAPAIFVNQVPSCLPVKFKHMHTFHAKFLNLPGKPSFLCGVVLLSDRSGSLFDRVLREIRKGLEEYCGDPDSYKRFVFGYDPVFERVVISVFPYFDFNTTLYYNSETGLKNMLNSCDCDPSKPLSEIKTKLWLNRIRYCVNPSKKENLKNMLSRVFGETSSPSVQDNLFAEDGIIMSHYLSLWHQQDHSYLMNQIRHPNDFLREYYTKDYNEYFQWRFNYNESPELFKIFDFLKWKLTTDGVEYVNYEMQRIEPVDRMKTEEYIKIMTSTYELFKSMAKVLITNYNSHPTDSSRLKELVSFVEQWRLNELDPMD